MPDCVNCDRLVLLSVCFIYPMSGRYSTNWNRKARLNWNRKARLIRLGKFKCIMTARVIDTFAVKTPCNVFLFSIIMIELILVSAVLEINYIIAFSPLPG